MKPEKKLEKIPLILLTGLYFVSFLCIWAFLFWKCRYGLANWDESFYLTLPYRFCRGDLPFLHEWHLSQTSGLLLVPLMKVYLAIFSGTEGIYLHFRWIFTACWGLVSLFCFFRLKAISLPGAMLASLVFLIYAPMGIMALCYNTLGILLLLSSCVIVCTAFRCRDLQVFFAGILFSGAVLCCPYLLFVYLAFSLLALFKKEKSLRRSWLFLTLGSGLIFLIFCARLLLAAPLKEYLSVIPSILNDPEHPSLHIPTKILVLITTTWDVNHFTIPFVFLSFLLPWLCRKVGRPFIAFIIVSAFAAYLLRSYWFINHYMFPLSLLGPCCYLLQKDDPQVRKLFLGIWVPGILYAFCLHWSSNQNFQAFTSAATVSTVASVVIACRYLSLQSADTELSPPVKACLLVVFASLICFQFSRELRSRYTTVYWEAGMEYQTVLAEEGPQKGILMNADIYEYYILSEQDIRTLCADTSVRKILFLSMNNWLYLSAQREFSTYSGWLSYVNDVTIERLDTYFRLFPEKLPDAVFIDRSFIDYAPHFEVFGYELADLPLSEYAFIMKRAADLP